MGWLNVQGTQNESSNKLTEGGMDTYQQVMEVYNSESTEAGSVAGIRLEQNALISECYGEVHHVFIGSVTSFCSTAATSPLTCPC